MSENYQYGNRVILEDENAFKKRRIMRFLLIIGAIVALVFAWNHFKKDDVVIYNGLSQNVSVQIGDESFYIAPKRMIETSMKIKDSIRVISTLEGDTLDFFNAGVLEDADTYIYNIANAAVFVAYEVVYRDEKFGAFYDNGFGQEPETEVIGAPRWFSSNADYVLKEAPERIEVSSHSSSASKWQLEVMDDIDPRTSIGIMMNDMENMNKMLNSNTIYSAQDDPNLVEWITYATAFDPDHSALKKRLELYPEDVATMRSFMSVGSEEDKAEMCAKVQAKSTNNPDNPDYYYLSCRCIEDEGEKNQAFVDGHSKWPENGWLAFANGYISASKEEWDKAIRSYSIAMSNAPASTKSLLPDIYRIKRISGKTDFSGEYMLDYNDDINYYKALKRGDKDQFYEKSDGFYHLLHSGRLTEAQRLIENSENSSYLMLLLALSKNGGNTFDAEIESSGAYVDAEDNLFYLAAAYSAKKGVDLSDGTNWSYSLETLGIEESDFNAYMDALKTKNKAKVVNLVNSITEDFVVRTKLKLMARIVIGEGISDDWKKQIDKMLYVHEKPVF